MEGLQWCALEEGVALAHQKELVELPHHSGRGLVDSENQAGLCQPQMSHNIQTKS